jgi:hypothetical protein
MLDIAGRRLCLDLKTIMIGFKDSKRLFSSADEHHRRAFRINDGVGVTKKRTMWI